MGRAGRRAPRRSLGTCPARERGEWWRAAAAASAGGARTAVGRGRRGGESRLPPPAGGERGPQQTRARSHGTAGLRCRGAQRRRRARAPCLQERAPSKVAHAHAVALHSQPHVLRHGASVGGVHHSALEREVSHGRQGGRLTGSACRHRLGEHAPARRGPSCGCGPTQSRPQRRRPAVCVAGSAAAPWLQSCQGSTAGAGGHGVGVGAEQQRIASQQAANRRREGLKTGLAR